MQKCNQKFLHLILETTILYNGLWQSRPGDGNYSPQAKLASLPVFVNEVSWNKHIPSHVCIVYGCFHTTTAEVRSSDRDYKHTKLKCLLSAFTEKGSESSRESQLTFLSNAFQTAFQSIESYDIIIQTSGFQTTSAYVEGQ